MEWSGELIAKWLRYLLSLCAHSLQYFNGSGRSMKLLKRAGPGSTALIAVSRVHKPLNMIHLPYGVVQEAEGIAALLRGHQVVVDSPSARGKQDTELESK